MTTCRGGARITAPRIAAPVGRSVKEWIGKTPDSIPPPSVQARIFERAGGVCHISRRKIAPGEKWDVEHVVALADGGENRESNLRPALRDKHREKTAAENAVRAKAKRKAARHIGVKTPPAVQIKSRGFTKAVRDPRAGKARIQRVQLPPRQMFRETTK